MRTHSLIQNAPFIEVTRGNYCGWYVELFLADTSDGVARLFLGWSTVKPGARWLVVKYLLISRLALKKWPDVYWR